MAILDEDELLTAEEAALAALEPPDRRQILARRAAALGVGVAVIVLVALGAKGCFDARKERALKDYVRDVTALTDEARQISEDFFNLLENPGTATTLEVEAEVKASRGAADGLVSRVEKLGAPSKLSDAQAGLEETFELRRDALAVISDRIATAFGREGRREAVTEIAEQMQVFLASDVIYRLRAASELREVLSTGEVDAEVPESQFLPEVEWLDANRVSEALARVRGGGAAAPGVHGLGLIDVIASPGDITLSATTPTTLPAGENPSLTVQVQNQGESDENDVNVTVRITGGGEAIELTRSINRIVRGETQAVTIPISPTPEAGRSLTVEVEVEAVPGERVEDNNKATYTVLYS